jgi:hypothetical protein
VRYKTKIGIWILSFPLVLASCATYSSIPPVPLTPGTTATCAQACQHRRELGCASAQPTQQGGTCEAVCENAETSGYTSENPSCLAQVKSCGAEEDACANPGH